MPYIAFLYSLICDAFPFFGRWALEFGGLWGLGFWGIGGVGFVNLSKTSPPNPRPHAFFNFLIVNRSSRPDTYLKR